MSKVETNIVIENARIGFRNFSGAAGKFNQAGNRNFCVFLEQDLGGVLEKDGWNVKWLKPREEEDIPQPYLQVALNYDNFPPKIVLVSSKGKTMMDDTTINILDWAEIVNVDIVIRPYNWEVNGKTGVKAYVKSMYVTLIEDEFESKYVDVPDSAASSLNGIDEDPTF